MKNKRILFIINGLGIGGAETHLLRLSKALVNKGYQVSILTISNDLSLIDRLDKRVNHINVPLRKSPGLIADIKKILKIVKQLQPDVIHAHLFQANIISRLIKFFYPSVRNVNTTHCVYDSENIFGVSPYKLYKLTKKWVDFHTAVSQEGLQKLIEHRSISTHKSKFIANGLFVNNYLPAKHQHQNFKWIAIGRLIPVKNYKLLIESFEKISRQFPGTELHIAGDGKYRDKLLELIQKKGLEEQLKLLGNVSNIPELLQNYDAFVISSHSEGLPMVLLEAMSAKLPIVSTRVGEIPEILKQSKGGLLVSPDNEKELAGQMQSLMMKNMSEIKKIGENNYIFVKNNYDIEQLSNNWINLYFQ